MFLLLFSFTIRLRNCADVCNSVRDAFNASSPDCKYLFTHLGQAYIRGMEFDVEYVGSIRASFAGARTKGARVFNVYKRQERQNDDRQGYFRVLGLHQKAFAEMKDEAEIKRLVNMRYKAQVMKMHPDRAGPHFCLDKFSKLCHAKEILMSQFSRRAYIERGVSTADHAILINDKVYCCDPTLKDSFRLVMTSSKANLLQAAMNDKETYRASQGGTATFTRSMQRITNFAFFAPPKLNPLLKNG